MSHTPIAVLLGTFGFGIFMFGIIKVILKKHYIVLNSILFWLALTTLLAIFAIFPQPIEKTMNLLGFELPSNGIFFCSIGFLVLHAFLQSMENAKMKTDFAHLIQELSIERSQPSLLPNQHVNQSAHDSDPFLEVDLKVTPNKPRL